MKNDKMQKLERGEEPVSAKIWFDQLISELEEMRLLAEWRLDMIPKEKLKIIETTLITSAIVEWQKLGGAMRGEEEERREGAKFQFELRGETCEACIGKTYDECNEISVHVNIGDHKLWVSGWYYPKTNSTKSDTPRGNDKPLALKFAHEEE